MHGNLVYVLNAGDAWLRAGLLAWPATTSGAIWGSNRTLGLGNTNPPDYLHSPGQVGFSPHGRTLIVTTKATTSAIDVFRVHDSGRLSKTAVSTTSATPVPFAFIFDPGSAGGH